MRWTELTPPEWRDRDERRWLPELKVTGSLQPFEKEYLRKDGSRVPVLIGVASFEEDGNQGVAFVLDLTERKCAEQAAEQLASIVESSDDAIVSKDLDGIIRTWNRGAERLFGYKAAEVIGRPITILIPPDRLDEEPGILARIRRGEPIDHYETVRRHKDGSLIDISLTVSPMRDAKDAIVGASKIARDITERKRAEQALRESEAKFRDYAETASDWFWEIGPDYKFTLLTENAFGSDPADRIGTACWDHALDLETEPEKWRLVWATLDSRKPFRDFVYCCVGGNGSPMYVKASGKPVFDANGEFRGYRGTGTDVTALMRAQEEHERLRQLESDLAHMNRLSMMGELAASLAHEITQPIATARNNARAAMRFLDRNPPDLGEVREALACIVDDADRAGDIIDRIRDHIKKAPPRKGRFDLNKAIDEVIGLARKRNHHEWGLGPNSPCGGAASRPRGSCSTATSRAELDPERGRSHEHGRGGATRVVDQHRANPDRWRSRVRARFRAGH